MKLTPPDGYRFNPILCPAHGSQEAPHVCPAMSQPPELQLACVANRPHAEGRWYITDATGCPRKTALRDAGAPISIKSKMSMMWGIAWHDFLEKWSGCLGESERAEKRLEFELFGLPVSCRMDKHDADGYVVDYKTSGESGFLIKTGQKAPWGSKERRVEVPLTEHVWQIEAERFGLESKGIKTMGGRIYYFGNTSGQYEKEYKTEWTGDVWSESRLAEFHPYDCPWTAKQLAEMSAQRRPLDQLPLVGATINFGTKTMCDPRYCEVSAACSMAPVPDLEGVF